MAEDEEDRRAGAGERPQDPLVERLRPDPSQPPQAVLTLAGLLGDSDRPGFRRLYFTRDLDYYAEFRTEDVVDTASIPPSQPPFLGDEATRLTLKRDAVVTYTRVRSPRPIDEFDLDVRLGAAGGPWSAAPGDFTAAPCPGNVTEGPTACGGACPTHFTCLGSVSPRRHTPGVAGQGRRAWRSAADRVLLPDAEPGHMRHVRSGGVLHVRGRRATPARRRAPARRAAPIFARDGRRARRDSIAMATTESSRRRRRGLERRARLRSCVGGDRGSARRRRARRRPGAPGNGDRGGEPTDRFPGDFRLDAVRRRGRRRRSRADVRLPRRVPAR